MKIYLLVVMSLFFSFHTFAQLPAPFDPPPKDIVRGIAVRLGKPPYSQLARQVGASGQVNVLVTIDKQGTVISAHALTGHPLLHQAAEQAAMESKFTPTTSRGKAIKFTGTIIFNFIRTPDWENIGLVLSALVNDISSVSAGAAKADESIWMSMDAEKTEFASLQANESIDGKKNRSQRLINVIRYKLAIKDSVDLWYFNLGIIVSGIKLNAGRMDNQKGFYDYIDELDEHVKAAPKEVLPGRLASLKEVTEKAKNKNLAREQEKELVQKLAESRNVALNMN